MDTISIDFPQISYKQKLMLLRNVQGKFIDITAKAGDPFQAPLAARGAAFGDLDNDGRVDIVRQHERWITPHPHESIAELATTGLKLSWSGASVTGTASGRAYV